MIEPPGRPGLANGLLALSALARGNHGAIGKVRRPRRGRAQAKGELVAARARWLRVSPADVQACTDAETAHAATREHYLVALEAYFALAERVRMSH